MDLREYFFRTRRHKIEMAKSLGIALSHLQHVTAGRRKPSVKLAKKIEEATEGKVTKEELLFPEEYKESEVE